MSRGRAFRALFTRNWREKLVALLLAFLFWYLIKAQAWRGTVPFPGEYRQSKATRL